MEYLAQYIIPCNKVVLHAVSNRRCGEGLLLSDTPLQLRLRTLFQLRFVLVLQFFA